MKNNAFPIFLAAWLILLAARGFTPAPAPVQTAETAEAVYTLEALSEEETFLSEGGRKLADYSYQLLVLSVANLEELSPEEAEAAQRNVETFHAKMSALMEELTAYGAVMGDDAAQMERDGYTIEAYYDKAAASGTMAGDLVSVRVDQCSYTGGAHPNRYTSSYLFDLRIGQFIDPTQLADDPAAFQCGAAELLRDAQVSPKAMTALYLGLLIVLNLFSSLVDTGFFSVFISILVSLLGTVLATGFALYCMAIRRGERAEFLTLFDGFSFVGKLILLDILISLFIFLWSLLFLIPGIVRSYAYFAVPYILAENPDLDHNRVLQLSMDMTRGHKMDIFFTQLSFIFWFLLDAITWNIVGVFYVRPYYNTTMAEVYRFLRFEALQRGFAAPGELPGASAGSAKQDPFL